MVYTGLVVEAKAHDGIDEGEGDIRRRWMGTPVVLEWGIPYGSTASRVDTAGCGGGGDNDGGTLAR